MAIESSRIKGGSLVNYVLPLSIRKRRIDGDLRFVIASLQEKASVGAVNRRKETVLASGLMRCIIRPIENVRQIEMSLQYPLSLASFLLSFASGALLIIFAPDATWQIGNPIDLLGLGLYLGMMFGIPLGALYVSFSLAIKCFDDILLLIDETSESRDEPSDAPKSPVDRKFES